MKVKVSLNLIPPLKCIRSRGEAISQSLSSNSIGNRSALQAIKAHLDFFLLIFHYFRFSALHRRSRRGGRVVKALDC